MQEGVFCVYDWDGNSLVTYYNYRIRIHSKRHQKHLIELKFLKPRKEMLTSSSQDNDQIKGPTNGFQSASSSL